MEAPAILPLVELSAWPTSVVGDEAKVLAQLSQAGLPIAPTVVIPAAVFETLDSKQHLIPKLRQLLEKTEWDDPHQLVDQCERVHRELHHLTWPHSVAQAIREQYHAWGSQALVSLRPSRTPITTYSIAQDAEQFDPNLEYIHGDANLLESLLWAWIKRWTPETLLSNYQQLLGQRLPASPWLLQLKANSLSSGLAFTHQPFTHAKTVLMYAVWGEYDLVSSPMHQASFEVDIRNHTVVRRNLRPQSHQLLPKLGELFEQPLSSSQGSQPPLTNEQVLELAELIHRLKQTQFDHQVVHWQLTRSGWSITKTQPLGDSEHLAETEARRVAVGQPVVKGSLQAQAIVIHHSSDWNHCQPGEIIVLPTLEPAHLPYLKHAGGIIVETAVTSPVVIKELNRLSIPTLMKARSATRSITSGTVVTLRADRGEAWMLQPSAKPLSKRPVSVTALITHHTPALTENEYLQCHGIVWNSREWFMREGLDPQVTRDQNQAQRLATRLISDATVLTGHQPPLSWYQLSDWTSTDLNQAARGTSSETPETNPALGYRGVSRLQQQPWLLDWELALFRDWKHQVPGVQLLVTGVRNLTELNWLKTQISEPFWLKVQNPHLTIEILTGELPPVAGFVFDVESIQAKVIGYDPNQTELAESYQTEIGPTQHLIATTWQYLRQCQPTVSTLPSLPLYLELPHADHRWLEWGVSMGATGIITKPQLVTQLKASIIETEAHVVRHSYASHT